MCVCVCCVLGEGVTRRTRVVNFHKINYLKEDITIAWMGVVSV